MLKAELEQELKLAENRISSLEAERELFEEKIQKELRRIKEDYCDEADGAIEDFCKNLNIEPPRDILTIRIKRPIGKTFSIYTDEDDEELEYELLELKES